MARTLRRKVYIALLAAGTLLVLYWRTRVPLTPLEDVTFRQAEKQEQRGFSGSSLRVVHLDLKGGPPKLDYLRKLLPLLGREGCNCLLIEYEDMFPYSDTLVNISAKNAYTKREIRMLLSWAHDLGMEVIPLVQTFGHLEHALKLPEWQGLRELPDFPSEVCPLKNNSLKLVEEMISQVVGMHKGLRYIHLGCDETFHIGACSQCSQHRPQDLYKMYVTQVAQLVHRKYPGVTPIIWDDMIRSWIPNSLIGSPLAQLVEPMIWAYSGDITTLIVPYKWHWYTRTFKRVWVASAFKGANTPTSDLPDIARRFNNTKSWLAMITGAQVVIAGFVLTGWSRYDHFAVLCELLPPSVPSLLLNLVTISGDVSQETKTYRRWRDAMSCSPSATFTDFALEEDWKQISDCKFPGADLYGAVLHLQALKTRAQALYTIITETNAWITSYNTRHNFSNPWRIIEDYTNYKVYSIVVELGKFKNDTRTMLLEYFDNYTVEEWIEQRLDPLQEKMSYLEKTMGRLIGMSTWARRPLTLADNRNNLTIRQ